MYQKIIIVGNLGRDPEMRYTPQGNPVTHFNVATNERWMDAQGQPQERTAWFRVTVWGKQAESCAQYLTKGRQVLVEGRLNTDPQTGGPRIWTGNDGIARASYEVTASVVRFLGVRGAEVPGEGIGGPEIEEEEGEIPF